MQSADQSSTFTLKDGRILGYQVYESSHIPSIAAPTVLYFHGFPGSHPEGGCLRVQASSHEVRLITLSRPGYGKSTFQPQRTFLDWPKDVIEFVDHLNIQTFYIIGMSGGCPYVLACLKTIPRERLLRTAIVSGAYPFCMTSKETLATNRILARASTSAWFSSLLPVVLNWYVGRFARDDKQAAKFEKWCVQEIGSRHPIEAQCLKDVEVRKAVVHSCKESFRQGGLGMAWEANMLSSDWGIAFQELDGTGLDIWYGKVDQNVSCSKAVAVMETLKGSELHLMEGEAHLSLLVNYADEILSHLLA